jgi:hypothetical protein
VFGCDCGAYMPLSVKKDKGNRQGRQLAKIIKSDPFWKKYFS